MRGYLLERYWPAVQPSDVRAVDERLRQLSAPDATFIASTLVLIDEVVFFEFRAVSETAVQALAARADLPCDRLVPAERQTHDD